MGFGLPSAVGAQFARPDKLVFALCGDGGFQMSIPELATVAGNALPIKIIVMNNGHLGMVRQWQTLFYNDRLSSVQLDAFPDAEKLAAAYGFKGRTVDKPWELAAAPEASREGLARSLYGIFWFFVFLAIVNSTIANANAGVNVSSRTAYAMGRIGAFPRFLAQVHPRHHSPALAILTGFVITVAVSLGLGLGYGPVTAFVMVATALVIVLAAIYILMNAACIGYFARQRGRFNPVLHLIIPGLGIVTFIPAWLTAAGIKAFSFVAPLAPPYSYMGPGVAGFMILGVIYLIYLYQTDPRRVVEVGLVHLDPLEEHET